MAIQLTPEERVLRQGAERASKNKDLSLMETYSNQLDSRLEARGAFSKETGPTPRRQPEPTISAADLATPPPSITVPPPRQETIPAGTLNVARNVSRNAQGFIEAQTAEQARLRELQSTFSSLNEQGSLSDFFTQQREQFGATPAALQELQDIQLRLNDMDTESGVTQTRIEGAAGQTLGTAQREVTQEQRENAVRTAGLAARAAVIQGNINTATQLARDAVNIEYQQRQLTAQNLLQQINMVQGQVDQQTAQLLEQEKRAYEAELAKIEEVKNNVATAMVNGASQDEIAQLTSNQLTDDQKIALAQQITARGAGEMRNLDIRQAEAQIAATNAQVAQGWARIGLEREKMMLDRAAAGDPQAISELGLSTEPDERAYQLETADIQMGVGAAEALLNNAEGVNLATGAFQSPLLATLTQSVGTGAVGGAAAGTVVPGVGTVLGAAAGAIAGVAASPFFYSRTKTAKDEALAAASFLVNDTTFQEIVDLRARGVTFGNMTEGERVAAGRAAQQLNAAAIIDPETGAVIGFRGSAETIRQYVKDILRAYEGRQEYLDRQRVITDEDEQAALEVWNSN